MSEQTNDSTPEKPLPKKVYWILGVLGVLALSVVYTNCANSRARAISPKASVTTQGPEATSPDAINSAEAQMLAQEKRLNQERENAAAAKKALDDEKQQAKDIIAQLHDGGDANIPAPTAAQQAAMRQTQANGRSGGAVYDRKKRLEDAYRSSMVVIDEDPQAAEFAGNRSPADPSPAAATQPATAPAKSPAAPESVQEKEQKKYAWDQYSGNLYMVLEGNVIECVLTNRLTGDFTGPVNVMVTTDVYSLNRQVLLIPQGTRILGESNRVGTMNQQRLAVVFHRMIMPDGFSWDLDKFKGLDQIGTAGLKDKVNNHYLKMFGAALAVGAIGGLAQIGNSTSGFGYDPGVSIRNGISQETGQEATQILDRFLNELPSITIREGNRVRVWITNDLAIPAYANHTVPGDL